MAVELEMKKSDPNRGEERLTGCGGARARGRPSDGWSSKTALDEPRYEVFTGK